MKKKEKITPIKAINTNQEINGTRLFKEKNYQRNTNQSDLNINNNEALQNITTTMYYKTIVILADRHVEI